VRASVSARKERRINKRNDKTVNVPETLVRPTLIQPGEKNEEERTDTKVKQ